MRGAVGPMRSAAPGGCAIGRQEGPDARRGRRIDDRHGPTHTAPTHTAPTRRAL